MEMEEVWRKIKRNCRIHLLEPGLSAFSGEFDSPSQSSTCYVCRVWNSGERACLLQHPPDRWWTHVATIVARFRGKDGEREDEREMMIAVASVRDDYEIGGGDHETRGDDWRIQSMFFFPEDMDEADVWDRPRWCLLPKAVARSVFDRAALDNVTEFERYFPYPLGVRLFQVACNPALPAEMTRKSAPRLFARREEDEDGSGTSFEAAFLTGAAGKRYQ